MQIFNSLTKQKEPLKPLHDNEVRLYACGMTVYDYCHLGHARSLIVFDMVVRYLRLRGYKVHYVRNITDVDDKIIKRAQELNESCDALTERFIKAMHDDEQALNILPPDDEPRATGFITEIIALIKQLLDNGSAYIGDNGDVYFDVRKDKDYGKLSHRNLDDLIAGARVEVSENKRDPLDFVLWKMAKTGEPHWSSPWGEGRPGWHIECSAMSTTLLGQPFDIHGGGIDLKFPHHENEIAQSETATQKPFAKLWMHVGLLMVNKEKMAKSLGNFFTIRDVLSQYPAEVIRYFMMSAHYRSPVNYAKETMEQATQALSRLYLALRGLDVTGVEALAEYEQKIYIALDDDLNTPEMLAIFFDMVREINSERTSGNLTRATQLAATLKKMANTFGILQQQPEAFLKGNISENDTTTIDALIAARQQARANKNWSEADRIRKQLQEMSIQIEDTAEGTVWRKGEG